MGTMTTEDTNTRRHTAPLAVRALRLALRTTARISPELAGRWANYLWYRTQRFAEPVREREWLQSARQLTLTHHGRPLAVCCWGEGPKAQSAPPCTAPLASVTAPGVALPPASMQSSIPSATVLLVHGWHGRGAQLGAFGVALAAAGFRAVGIDAPAHGRTPGRATNLPEVSDALCTVARHFAPVHGVIAHSFGVPCTLYALTESLRIDRMVALAAPASIEFLFDSFANALALPETVRHVHRRLLEQRFGPDLWQRFGPLSIAPSLNVPALFLHDTDDHDVPWQEGASLAAAWPGAILEKTSGLGHRRILRDATVVRRAVEFLSLRR
jgi:pimeloyl-ACP methyl ester carboxylesterase